MVHRQNKSLKRLAKTMNDTLQKVHESPLKSNTEAMIDIIKQIKKVPVAEARAVIARDERNNASRVITPTPYQEGVTASRQRRRTRDYGDGNREHYVPGSSSSSIRNGRHNNHMLFAPNPPFIQEDWDMRNRNKSDSRENL